MVIERPHRTQHQLYAIVACLHWLNEISLLSFDAEVKQ